MNRLEEIEDLESHISDLGDLLKYFKDREQTENALEMEDVIGMMYKELERLKEGK
jgi:hypothetical protein